MQKAGYVRRTGCRAFDCDGNAREVVELHIMGNHYAIRLADLVKGISGHVFVQVEALTREWDYYFGATCGLAQISVSGKALNIDLFDTGSFTVSLAALRSVIYRKQRQAVIVKIPEQPALPAWKDRRATTGQQRITAVV